MYFLGTFYYYTYGFESVTTTCTNYVFLWLDDWDLHWEQKRIGTFNLGTRMWGPSIWEQECGGPSIWEQKFGTFDFGIKMRDQI